MGTVVNARDDLPSYRSPRRVLVDWFRKSRDNWKQKHARLKAEIKRFKNRAYDLERSRDHWKEQAAAYQRQLDALQVQVEQLKAQVTDGETSDGQKKGALPAATLSR